MATAQPKRKQKQMLTLIPEQDRAITYRFEFAVVGEGAKAFAQKAVDSEMAEAFHPNAKQLAEKGGNSGGNEECEDDEHLRCIDAPRHAESTPPVHKQTTDDKDKLVLFFPVTADHRGQGSVPLSKLNSAGLGSTGLSSMGTTMGAKPSTTGGTGGLARIRFQPVEAFCESLPLKRDPNATSNLAVVFLFWKVGKGQDATARGHRSGRNATEDQVRDFVTRMAEINHSPEPSRPYLTILAFDADPDQVIALKDFKDKNDKVSMETYSTTVESEEEIIMEALQQVCDNMIKNASQRRNVLTTQAEGTAEGAEETKSTSRSSCCVVL